MLGQREVLCDALPPLGIPALQGSLTKFCQWERSKRRETRRSHRWERRKQKKNSESLVRVKESLPPPPKGILGSEPVIQV